MGSNRVPTLLVVHTNSFLGSQNSMWSRSHGVKMLPIVSKLREDRQTDAFSLSASLPLLMQSSWNSQLFCVHCTGLWNMEYTSYACNTMDENSKSILQFGVQIFFWCVLCDFVSFVSRMLQEIRICCEVNDQLRLHVFISCVVDNVHDK